MLAEQERAKQYSMTVERKGHSRGTLMLVSYLSSYTSVPDLKFDFETLRPRLALSPGGAVTMFRLSRGTAADGTDVA